MGGMDTWATTSLEIFGGAALQALRFTTLKVAGL